MKMIIKSVVFMSLMYIIAGCALHTAEIWALQDFYYFLNGSSWVWLNIPGSPWNFTEPFNACENWQGLQCSNCTSNSGTTTVVAINLSNYHLRGVIPESFGNLTGLQELDVSRNAISGSLPHSIQNLSRLQVMKFQFNLLNKDISDDLFIQMSNLTDVFLNNNALSRTIPNSLFTCTLLKSVYLDYNHFTGSLSSNVGNLIHLNFFYLSDNYFFGALPTAINQLTSLIYVSFSNNKFYGSIDAISSWINLEYLSLRTNELTGTIPQDIGNCRKLQFLRLDNNSFVGTIPYSFAQLSKLQGFTCSNNSLSGSIQVLNRTNFMFLSSVNLDDNSFTGTIPDELFSLPSLKILSLSQNCFMGSLPSTVCLSSKLSSLILDGLTSGRTCRRYLLLGLSVAYIPNNIISGTIPSCIYSLRNLSIFHFSGNGIRTALEVPLQLGSRFSDLSLSYNQLEGTIPYALKFSSLSYLDLSYNRIVGTIDGEISNFTSSQVANTTLNLQVNRLSGGFPQIFHRSFGSLRILTGNIFQCNTEDIPLMDPAHNSYVCGSSQLNESAYVFVCIFICFSLWSLVLYFFRILSEKKKDVCEIDRGSFIADNEFALAAFKDISSSMSSSSIHKSSVAFSSAAIKEQANIYYDAINLHVHQLLESFISASMGQKLFSNEILQMPKLFRYIKLLHQLRLMFIILFVIVILVLAPLYIGFSYIPEFNTHSFKYGWRVTAAFTTGVVPAAIILSMWIVIATLSVWRVFVIKAMLKLEERMIGVPLRSNDKRTKSTRYLKYRELKKVYRECRTWSNYFALKHSFQVTGFCWLLAILNSITMIGLNALYVYGELSQLSSASKFLLQTGTAAVKLSWNLIILRYLISMITVYKGDPNDKKVNLYISMVAFNNIAAPVIATAVTDSRCLKSIFIAAAPIVSTFNYATCGENVEGSVSVCTAENVHIVSNSFAPPFIYSYQCGSAIITNYVPMFNYSYTIFLLWPLLLVLLTKTDPNRIPKWLLYHLPGILWPNADVKLFRKILNPDLDIIQQLLHLFLLLTFGLTSLQLAAAICCSAVASTTVTQVLIVRYIGSSCRENRNSGFSEKNPMEKTNLSHLEMTSNPLNACDSRSSEGTREHSAQKLSSGLEILENSCSGSWRRLLNGGVLVFVGATCFYGCVLFDVASDQNGAISGIWLPIICIIAPLLLYISRHTCIRNSYVLEKTRLLSGRFSKAKEINPWMKDTDGKLDASDAIIHEDSNSDSSGSDLDEVSVPPMSKSSTFNGLQMQIISSNKEV